LAETNNQSGISRHVQYGSPLQMAALSLTHEQSGISRRAQHGSISFETSSCALW